MDFVAVKQALISVTDKTGLEEFARFLVDREVRLFSTGGTKKKLQQAGIPVSGVSELTSFPEILDGRVKTLHPHIHASILADKQTPEHMQTLHSLGLRPFDLICVNLYDFASAIEHKMPSRETAGEAVREAVEYIDIGGPTMLRAAAKNFHSVLVVPAVKHYARVQEELAGHDMKAPLSLRRDMATCTFAQTSAYDAMITQYLEKKHVAD